MVCNHHHRPVEGNTMCACNHHSFKEKVNARPYKWTKNLVGNRFLGCQRAVRKTADLTKKLFVVVQHLVSAIHQVTIALEQFDIGLNHIVDELFECMLMLPAQLGTGFFRITNE